MLVRASALFGITMCHLEDMMIFVQSPPGVFNRILFTSFGIRRHIFIKNRGILGPGETSFGLPGQNRIDLIDYIWTF